MSEELAVIENKFEALAVHRDPVIVLEEAKKAANALTSVINGKKKKVTFNGETYLENEDWVTVARFYGVTSRIRLTNYIEYGDVRGFEATAEAYLVGSGEVISSAEAMCLNDEPNWSKKPLFQLRSMAQTRASSRVLRQVFGWVVVLAGYKPTPAEEMDGVDGQPIQGRSRPANRQQTQSRPVTKDKVLCSSCGKTDSHDPSCKYYPRNPSSTGQVVEGVVEAKAESKAAEGEAKQTQKGVFKITEVKQNFRKCNECKSGTGTHDQKCKSKAEFVAYRLLNLTDEKGGDGSMFVWHKHLYEIVDGLKGKSCVLEFSSKPQGDKTFYSVEHIHRVGDVAYVDDVPVAAPSAKDVGFEAPVDEEIPW